MRAHQVSPTHWRVESATQADVEYDVHQHGTEWDCSCPNRQYRKRLCHHIVEVWDTIKHGARCETCHGRGIIKLSLLWYEDDGSRSANELACIECDGRGRVKAEAPALPSQDELKRIFA